MKKFTSKIIAILTLMLLVLTGCTKDIDDVDTIEFQNTPQSTYYQVSQDKIKDAIEQMYNEIVIKINGNPYALSDAVKFNLVEVSGLELNELGTHTLVIRYRKTTLTYVYRIVSSVDLFAGGFGTKEQPYIITTPEHFINIGTKVLGVPRPLESASDNAWEGYFKLSFPYLSNDLYFKIVNNLDFSGKTYTTMGTLGDKHYVPFRGTILGNAGGTDSNPIKPVISNLVIQSASPTNENTALFAGATNARFENLKFVSPRVVTTGEKAALLWSAPGLNTVDSINIVKDVEVEFGYYQAQRSGGLALESNNAIFMNCVVKDSTIIGLAKHTGGIGAYASGSGRKYKYSLATSDGTTEALLTNSIVNDKLGTDLTESDNEAPVYTAFVYCSIPDTTIFHPERNISNPMVGDFTSNHQNNKYSIDGVIGTNTLDNVVQMTIMSPENLFSLSTPGSTYEYHITFGVTDGISTVYTVKGIKSDFYSNGLKDLSLKYVEGVEQEQVEGTYQLNNKYEKLNVDGTIDKVFYFSPKLDSDNKVNITLVVIETEANGNIKFYTHYKNEYKVDLVGL